MVETATKFITIRFFFLNQLFTNSFYNYFCQTFPWAPGLSGETFENSLAFSLPQGVGGGWDVFLHTLADMCVCCEDKLISGPTKRNNVRHKDSK